MFTDQKKRWEKSGITRWVFDEVPDTIELSGTDKSIRMAYPGLTVETGKPGQVSLRLYPSREQAVEMHLSGVKMLAMLHLAKELRFLKKALKLPGKTASKISYFGNAAKVEQQIFEKVTTILFSKNIRTRKAFTECLDKATPTLHQTGQTLMSLVAPVLSAVSDTWVQLKKWQTRHLSNHPIRHFIDQRLSNLAQLIPTDFITLYDMDRLDNLPLYIRAISVRTQRAIVDLEKDRRKTEQIQVFSEYLGDFLSGLSSATSDEKRQAIEAYFWMLETFKVSIFAQELKTPRPVSAKRLKEQVAEIERMT
jgi:ATP-dependent helicase HrpA